MKRLGLIALITALGLALSVPSFGMTAHRHHKRHRPVAVISRVNINTASREQLMQLPHINEATADRIIAGRPWDDAHDLVTKGIITQDSYNDIHLKVSTKLKSKKTERY